MKTQKNKMMPLVLILLMMLSAAGLQAQIRVGGSVAPNPNAVLDLNPNDTAIGTKGLLLPRVALVSATDATPLMEHISGIVVFNTATSNDVSPGVYYNDGTKWLRTAEELPIPEPTLSLQEAQIEVNELLSTQSVLYYGEITKLDPNAKTVSIKAVFSDPMVAKTLFTVTPMLKPNKDGTTITWSLHVQNFNLNPKIGSVLEKIVIVYECADGEELPTSFLGSYIFEGW